MLKIQPGPSDWEKMIHCCICKGNIKSGCVCITTAKELFPNIEKDYSYQSDERRSNQKQ